jgi:hypothetical protein
LFPLNTNLMMANDFGFYFVKTFELQRGFDSPGVPSSPLESFPVLEISMSKPVSRDYRSSTDLKHPFGIAPRACHFGDAPITREG